MFLLGVLSSKTLVQDGESPHSLSFVRACHLISGKATVCYIAFESRIQHLRESFLQCANRNFCQVCPLRH